MPLNDNYSPVSMKAMFKCISFSDNCCDKIVDSEGLSSLEKYQKCSVDRCKDTMETLRYPGGNIAGKTVSANATHNMMIVIDVLNIWECTHRHRKTIGDVKTTGNIFELAERQGTLEKNHNNKLYLESFVPY